MNHLDSKNAGTAAHRVVMAKNGENKLLRTQLRLKKTFVTTEKQPTVDEHLSRLEEDIRRLKIEFDIYFNGAAKRPPYDTNSIFSRRMSSSSLLKCSSTVGCFSVVTKV